MSKNIQMKNWNGETWDDLFPVTKSKNVLTNENKNLESYLTDLSTNVDENFSEITDTMDKSMSVNMTRFELGSDITETIRQSIDLVKNRLGATVYIPKGTFRVSEPVAIPSNITLVGAGIDETVIEADDNMNVDGHSTIFTNENPTSNGNDENIHIRELTVDIRKLNQSTNYNMSNIEMRYVKNCSTKWLKTIGSIEYSHVNTGNEEFLGRSPIFFMKPENCITEHCHVLDGDYNNISYYLGSTDNVIQYNLCEGIGNGYHGSNNSLGSGIQVTSMLGQEVGKGNKILYNTCRNNTLVYSNGERPEACGIIVHSDRHTQVVGNTVENVSGDGIRIIVHTGTGYQYYNGLLVTGNKVKNLRIPTAYYYNDPSGIRLESLHDDVKWNQYIITNNEVSYCANGIYLKDTASGIVNNNTFNGINIDGFDDSQELNGTGGIVFDGVLSASCQGNLFTGSYLSQTPSIVLKDNSNRNTDRIIVMGNVMRSTGGIDNQATSTDNIINNNGDW